MHRRMQWTLAGLTLVGGIGIGGVWLGRTTEGPVVMAQASSAPKKPKPFAVELHDPFDTPQPGAPRRATPAASSVEDLQPSRPVRKPFAQPAAGGVQIDVPSRDLFDDIAGPNLLPPGAAQAGTDDAGPVDALTADPEHWKRQLRAAFAEKLELLSLAGLQAELTDLRAEVRELEAQARLARIRQELHDLEAQLPETGPAQAAKSMLTIPVPQQVTEKKWIEAARGVAAPQRARIDSEVDPFVTPGEAR